MIGNIFNSFRLKLTTSIVSLPSLNTDMDTDNVRVNRVGPKCKTHKPAGEEQKVSFTESCNQIQIKEKETMKAKQSPNQEKHAQTQSKMTGT